MDSKNGSDYAQNHDIIVKWLAGALRGQTLDVIGVKTGRIEEVCGISFHGSETVGPASDRHHSGLRRGLRR